MLPDTATRRRMQRPPGPWLIAIVRVWLAFDNGPALASSCFASSCYRERARSPKDGWAA